MDEDDLLAAELSRAAALFDPPPPSLAAAAGAAFGLRDLDAGLAELTFDSLDSLAVRAAAPPSRLLTFRSGAVTVELEVTPVRLVGRVEPARAVRVDVRTAAGPETAITADAYGRFTADTPAGPFSLRCHTGPRVVTEWIVP